MEKKNKTVTLTPWKHYKEIPKEEYRPLKKEELTEDFYDWIFRRKYRIGKTAKITKIDKDNNSIYLDGMWFLAGELFESWDVKKPLETAVINGVLKIIYTDWQPAGMKV